MSKNNRKQALNNGSVRWMRANNGPTVWSNGFHRWSRVAKISLLLLSGQTWLTFTIKVKFERLMSNGIEFVEKMPTTLPTVLRSDQLKYFGCFMKRLLIVVYCLGFDRNYKGKLIKISENNSRIHVNAFMTGADQKMLLIGKKGVFSPFKSWFVFII